jgi:aspartyl-tRNA(Asn)/glutamyl-tRNA(Gln) amidotransferase subunit C
MLPRPFPRSKPSCNANSMKSEMDVKYVAHLARLSLSTEEEQKIGAQLASVLGYIDKLKEVDVRGVEPTAHAFPLFNVTRQDEVHPSISNEVALRNAPAHANGLFIVPKIVE